MYRLDSINLFPMPYIDLSYTAFYYSQSRLLSFALDITIEPLHQIFKSDARSDQISTFRTQIFRGSRWMRKPLHLDAKSRLPSRTPCHGRRYLAYLSDTINKSQSHIKRRLVRPPDYGGLPPSEADLGCWRLGSILA